MCIPGFCSSERTCARESTFFILPGNSNFWAINSFLQRLIFPPMSFTKSRGLLMGWMRMHMTKMNRLYPKVFVSTDFSYYNQIWIKCSKLHLPENSTINVTYHPKIRKAWIILKPGFHIVFVGRWGSHSSEKDSERSWKTKSKHNWHIGKDRQRPSISNPYIKKDP